MCLNTEDLKMKYWKEYDTYVGVGYKILPNNNLYPFNEWQEANGWSPNGKPNKISGITKESTSQFTEYHAGFHIFLNIEDAKNYGIVSFNNGRSNVYKVDYTDVIGFGEQRTTSSYGKCVIARHMYVHSNPIITKDNPFVVEKPSNYQTKCTCVDCREYTKYKYGI